MPAERLCMRHTREILRHKWVLQSSHRQTTAALGGSHGSITQTLQRPQAAHTALTNVFTGRPARGIVNHAMRALGPMADDAPAFPLASAAMAPLRQAAEARGSDDYSPLWAGQNVSGTRPVPAAERVWDLARADLQSAAVFEPTEDLGRATKSGSYLRAWASTCNGVPPSARYLLRRASRRPPTASRAPRCPPL